MVLEEKQVGPMCEYYFQAKFAMLGRLLQGWVALRQDLPSSTRRVIPASCCCFRPLTPLTPLSLSSFSSISPFSLGSRLVASLSATHPCPTGLFVSLPTAYGELRLREVTTLPYFSFLNWH